MLAKDATVADYKVWLTSLWIAALLRFRSISSWFRSSPLLDFSDYYWNIRPSLIEFSPDFREDRTLFIGTFMHGLFRSVDGGSSFSLVLEGAERSLYSVAVSPEFGADGTARHRRERVAVVRPTISDPFEGLAPIPRAKEPSPRGAHEHVWLPSEGGRQRDPIDHLFGARVREHQPHVRGDRAALDRGARA